MASTSAPASAATNTGSRRRKFSSQELAEKIRTGAWWPFDRADPGMLEQVERNLRKKDLREVPDAPF